MPLSSIQDYCKLNLPGLTRIEYLPTAMVDRDTYEYLVNSEGEFIGIIEPIGGAEWLTVQVLPQGRGWSESNQAAPQGAYYPSRLTGLVRGLRPAVSLLLWEMEEYRYLVRFTDRKGAAWLIGSMQSPLDFRADADTGDQDGGLNAYSISFFGDCVRRAIGGENAVLSE